MLALSAAAIAGGFASFAAAQEGPSRSVSVSYADLDLSRASGRETLDRRISNAVARVCSPQPALIDLAQAHAYEQCRSDALSGAHEQMTRLFEGQALAQASVRVGRAARRP